MKIPLIWLKDYIDTNKSAKELASSFTQLGLMLDKPLDKSQVLDLEHRMDRADWLSLIGCTRDLAAFEGQKLNLPKGHTKPGKAVSPEDKIKVTVDTESVRRFQTRLIKGIKVGPSPKWLIERLTAYGMDSINNIVDITNFVMIEYGQPMHAQDIAKLKGKDITIRHANKNEKLITLLGTEVTLDKDAFVLTSGGEITVIGGIVGGKNTGVGEDTKDIILDSGCYDSRVIRKVSRRLKIINESVSRNDKFLDPRTIDFALNRATELILEIAGGTYYANDDYYPSPVAPQTMTLRLSRLVLLSGMNISLSTAKKILKSLEYTVVEEGNNELTVEVPYFRTDIEVEDDLVSDILRINNYTNIPSMALSTPTPIDLTGAIYRFEDRLRDLMVAQGAHEHITSSLTESSADDSQVVLVNALTSDQNALRTSLEPGLHKVQTTYTKHNQKNTVVFEIGKVFRVTSKSYLEGRLLTALYPSTKGVGDGLTTLLSSLGINKYHISKTHDITVGKILIGSINSSSFTLVTDSLMEVATSYSGIISEFDHSTSLDLSLLTSTQVKYADIAEAISSLNANWINIACKNMTAMDDQTNNYLITITWDAKSVSVQEDKAKILETLKTKLNITSKS